ncbi:hypothetical protein AHMF7605_27005 [Adhaeribacter arboris]|uniref:Uncharacterized protein n=1 Tax=Adhaeribacter arboris TaxID=2072846 RepID=A0A2T2YN25_9BACT|nr:hypothetical protein [Adhaeribacter arboris]PSR56886.1 hypothetical protein AHMF7605_27005 [Adhaeribacter arboris]
MKRETIVLLLTILIVILGVGTLFKYNILTFQKLATNKDLIGVFKDIITIIALIVGALLSYFRFFSGRTFSTKADIELEAVLIETPTKSIMHALTVSIINKGSLTIWEPEAILSVQEYTENGAQEEVVYEQFLRTSYFRKGEKGDVVIDAGEKAYFTFLQEFNLSTWAVTYTAEIRNDRGRIWQKAITVENKAKSAKS